MTRCQIKGCTREVALVRHGLCLAHYKRFQRAAPKTQADVRAFLAAQARAPQPRARFAFPAAAGARS